MLYHNFFIIKNIVYELKLQLNARYLFTKALFTKCYFLFWIIKNIKQTQYMNQSNSIELKKKNIFNFSSNASIFVF